MNRNPQKVANVRRLLTEALAGVEGYLNNWPTAPQDFTTETELRLFATKLREMQTSLEESKVVEILGLWRIMETWPFNNELRQKIVEAEYEYDRLKPSGQ